jgi:hypothetical protein
MNFLLAILLSFLPPYYRRFFANESQAHIIRAAIVTAFLELVFACILYAQGFVDYIHHAVIGPAAFLEYFFSWQGLIFAFFFIDGTIRLLAAIAGQAIGATPIYVAAWLHAYWHRRSLKKAACPLVPDIVEKADAKCSALRIRSCRPRRNWDKWMTVMYEEGLYEIAGTELGSAPRPYVYLLRPKPDSKVIRGLHRYSPEEVFHLEDQ